MNFPPVLSVGKVLTPWLTSVLFWNFQEKEMELGRKSRARQPMATELSSDRGLSQETRGKTDGEDGLSEDQRGIKEKWRDKNLSSCLLSDRRSLYTLLTHPCRCS